MLELTASKRSLEEAFGLAENGPPVLETPPIVDMIYLILPQQKHDFTCQDPNLTRSIPIVY
jgi:hypothetical protein